MWVAYQLRDAALADYPGLQRVARETLDHHVAAIPTIFRGAEDVFPESYFAALLADEDADVVVAVEDDAIVGYATMRRHGADLPILVPRTYAVIHEFGVLASHRRKGVGRAIIAWCRARAMDRGATSLELDCWEANQDGLRFYAALGMRVQRRHLAIDL
jgi:GNAT superfamily N-acetyltransferase